MLLMETNRVIARSPHSRPARGHIDAPTGRLALDPIVLLDELDTPDLRDPAVQLDRGAFRRTVETCVRVAPVNAITPRVAALCWPPMAWPSTSTSRSSPIPVPATTVRLTVQGAYDGEENVHYRVELVKHRGTFDKYTYAVELLWDDRNASTVTRLVSDADQYARSIDVQSSEGFATGDFLRLEGDGARRPGTHEVTDVDGSRLSSAAASAATFHRWWRPRLSPTPSTATPTTRGP